MSRHSAHPYKAEHWLKREIRKLGVMASDPITWMMTLVLIVGIGLILMFLLRAADNFGTYYAFPAACAADFTQARLFFLSMLTPLFFVAVFVFMGEMTVVLGLRKKKHRVSYGFLFGALVAMLVLGATSFVLLSC